MKKLLTVIFIFSLFTSVNAADEILDKNTFLKSALGVSDLPTHKYLIIKDDVEDGLFKIMKDSYHMPVIKYWKVGNKVAFILEAIGKHEYITTGYLVENNEITDAKVLVYRENYGYEIKYDYFLDKSNVKERTIHHIISDTIIPYNPLFGPNKRKNSTSSLPVP